MSYARLWIVLLRVSIDFSSQEFLVNSSTVPYNIALTGQNKKEIDYVQNLIKSADDDRQRTTSTIVSGERRLGTERLNSCIPNYFTTLLN